MKTWHLGFGASMGVILAVSVSACAPQAHEPASISTDVAVAKARTLADKLPTDRWMAGYPRRNTGVASAARDAALVFGCTERNHEPAMLIQFAHVSSLPATMRTVAIRFDGAAPIEQSWFSDEEGYGTIDTSPGFYTVVEGLKKHREVEFVLSESGKALYRNRFTLNGAADIVVDVLAECEKL